MEKPSTPMLDKMLAVRAESQRIGEFIEWLQSKGYSICEYRGENYLPWIPTLKTIEELLAEFYDVDLRVAEQERRAVLDYLRNRTC